LDRETRSPDDQPRWLTSETLISASVQGSDHIDRVKTEDVQVERGSEDLAVGRSRMAVTRVQRGGTCIEYATRERVWWFVPQNSGRGSEEERMTHGGIGEFASRRSY
jgi:hypothetical protein